jgi:signal transduction histidine kinase
MRIAAVAVGGALLCCISVAVTLSNADAAHPGLAAAGRALMVAAPVAVGCYAWRRRPGDLFGPLLIAAGFGWFLTTLAESNDATLYSIGRVAGWLVELELVYLALSFPTGRLHERVDRILVAAVAAAIVLLYLPTALFADSFPVPAPYTSCEDACPANVFFVLDSQPAFVDDVLRPVRELVTVVVFLAVTARLALRVRHATRAMRRVLSPVLAVALARVFLLALAVGVRRADADSPAAEILTWTVAMGLPAMAASFFLGLLRLRLFAAGALEALGRRLHPGVDPAGLRTALAEALDDPALRLAYWSPADGGRWVDADGRPVELPAPASGQCVTEVSGGGRRIAAIVHDEALREQQDLIDAAAAYARIALENQRLVANAARVLATADGERRRIERDLHDGAQQRLVALRIKLELTGELVREDPDAGLAKLHALGGEIEETLEEIRSLARGVYPAVLSDQGLPEALRAAALRAPIAATVEPDGIGRYEEDVESAVYFCCLEALQNASKHARAASLVTIVLAEDEALRFEVRDDGAGFDADGAQQGAGMTNMRDRMTAVGGRLTITSAPGGGTIVEGSIPLGRREIVRTGR